MRKIILLITIIVTNSTLIQAQKIDKLKLGYDLSCGVLPLKIAGVYDKSNYSAAPQYRWVDTTGWAFTIMVHLGVNVPFYKTENWSIGGKVHLGFGGIGALVASEGLQSIAFDCPAYLYFRHYGGKKDFSVLAGYKYTLSALSYHLPILGIQYNVGSLASIRLYGSPKRSIYYSKFTDGRDVPAIKIGEYGVSLNFGL